jgi:hypothetical protein
VTRSRLVLLGLAVVVVLLLLPSLPAHAAPAVGLNINGGAGAQNDPAFTRLNHRWQRYFVFWSTVEPEPGRFDFHVVDAYRRIAESDGKKSLFVITGAPAWANGGAGVLTPPTDPAQFGSFAGRFANALGRHGDAYEIWNEPDEFWNAPDRADPTRYVALLRSAYRGIKDAAPRATVLFGPMTGNNYDYVAAAYRAGAKGAFDAMAVHTDTACLVNGPTSYLREPAVGPFKGRIYRFSFLGYRTVRRVMVANGDRRKPIWMTEFGWSSPPDNGPTSCQRGASAGQKPAGVSEARQARYLRQAYHCMRRDRYVKVAMWFNSRDLGQDNTELNNYGLIRHDGSRRPAYRAFADIARGRDRIRGGCGDFRAPQLRVLSPRPGQVSRLGERLTLRARSSSSDVSRISFRFEGKLVRNFTGTACRRSCSYRWFRPAKLPRGTYTLRVEAHDLRGNVRTRFVRFVKRGARKRD